MNDKKIDQMGMDHFSNLTLWVDKLNIEIADLLRNRLVDVSQEITTVLSNRDLTDVNQFDFALELEIKLQNQKIFADPSLESILSTLVSKITNVFGIFL